MLRTGFNADQNPRLVYDRDLKPDNNADRSDDSVKETSEQSRNCFDEQLMTLYPNDPLNQLVVASRQ